MKYVLFSIVTCIAMLIGNSASSQDFSNKGKDFWVIYTGHVDSTVSRLALYITSDQNAKGQVEVNGGTIPFTVTANNVTTVQFTNTSNPSNSVVYNGQLEGVGVKRGIHIIADKPVVVYAHILNAARSGSTLVLPTAVLGKEYYASSYNPISSTSADRSEFAVVATVDNTIVEITPTARDANGAHSANVPYQVSLSKGDVYQYQSNGDLTGSHIKSVGSGTVSCQPIAVFSGSTRTSMGCSNPNSGDNLYQQLFPFASWGRLFYTAPFVNRAYDVFRIIVQDVSTVVSVNGVPLNPSSLVNGRFYEFNTQGNNTARIISSNKPICVFQYLISQNCDGVLADPEMIILNAVDQTLNNITVMSARNNLTPPNTNIVSHFLNIIFKTNNFSSLLIDGKSPAASPVAIPGTGYSYLQENVTNSTNVNPAHHITSDSGFICIAYGYGNIESYGYNAGTNVIDRYQYITMQNLYASINFPATCTYTPFNFSITLPYQPTSLNWDFNNNSNLSPNTSITNNAPRPDSSFVLDGKTLYVYKLKANFTFSAVGTFPIKVIAQNATAEGCSGTQEINYDVVVYERPKANFSITGNGCLSNTMQFADSTNSDGRAIINYSWSFGDNTIAAIKNPSKKYTTAGNYNVKLQAITDIGCVNETTKPVAITSDPVAGFRIPQPTCVSNAITLTDTSKVGVGTIAKWTWDFGDSSSLVMNTTGSAVSHTYANTGAYTVSLNVETAAGCTNNISKTVSIHAQPVADFIVPDVCLNDAFAKFIDSTYIADGSQSTLKYLWHFGDANASATNPDTSILLNPQHKYSATGNYNATLKVTSQFGCASIISKPFFVNGSFPKAAFIVKDSNNLCSNTTVEITNTSTVVPGVITKLEIIWDDINAPAKVFTDESPAAGKIYTNTYPSLLITKKYEIRFKAYSGQSCVNEVVKTITVNGSPDVTFLPVPDICFDDAPRQITQVTETSGLTGVGSFSGTGITSTGMFNAASTTLNTNSGIFPILYTYTTDKGCKDTASGAITVWKVSADAGPDIVVLEGNSATLNPVVSGDNLSYNWTPVIFLSSSKIKSPTTSPRNNVTYKLTITGNASCTASDTILVKVVKQPEVPNAFSPNNDGVNDTWNIRYLSASADATVEIYNRYGTLVYRSIGYSKPWDGTRNGSALPVGVYYYIIDPKFGRAKIAGSVTILR
ncbi:PKD domain-containing protein [Segetibacter aerophilus]|nr:PKD domain-containing protein [Segetibacter aerophilus]